VLFKKFIAAHRYAVQVSDTTMLNKEQMLVPKKSHRDTECIEIIQLPIKNIQIKNPRKRGLLVIQTIHKNKSSCLLVHDLCRYTIVT